MAKHFVQGEELQAYLDGELAPRRQTEVEKHLGQCRECARLLEDLKRVSATLQRWQVEPAPSSLRPPATQVEAKAAGSSGVEARKSERWWAWRPLGFSLAGAGTVVLLLIVIGVVEILRTPPVLDSGKDQGTLVLSSPEATAPAAPEAKREGAPSANRQLHSQPGPAEPKPSSPRVFQEEGQLRVSGEGRLSDRRKIVVAEADQPAESLALSAPEPAREGFLRKDEAADSVGPSPQVVESESKRDESQVGGIASGPLSTGEFAGRDSAEKSAAGGRLLAQKSAFAPMIAYRVWMTIEVKDFDASKQKLLKAVEEVGGYIAQAEAAETPGEPRRGDFVVRVPEFGFAGLLDHLRALGRVTQERQANEELTPQIVDLDARLRNARATEDRLISVLNQRTGKVREILEVEREIARSREEIERMEADRKHLVNQVAMSTVTVALVEEFKAQLEPAPLGTGTKLRNALIQGYESVVAWVVGLLLFLARYGLSFLFWFGLGWLAWRKVRRPLLELLARGFGMGSAWQPSK